jgi:hypothetical protein
MLTMMAVSFIASTIFSINDMSQDMAKGYAVDPNINVFVLLSAFVVVLACLGFNIASIVSFVRFILNVNRNEVFTRKNVSLLRRYGIYMLLAIASGIINGVLMVFVINMNIGSEYWDLLFIGTTESIFALIVAEAFCIGIKLQEEQNLTI